MFYQNPEETLKEVMAELNRHVLYQCDGVQLVALGKKIQKAKEKVKKETTKWPRVKIALLGSYSTQFLRLALEAFLWKQQIYADIFEAEYNSVLAEVLSDASGLYAFKPDIVVLLGDTRDIREFPPLFSSSKQVTSWAEKTAAEYSTIWQKISRKCHCSIFQTVFTVPIHRQLGNLECNQPYSKQACIIQLNRQLMLIKQENVTLIDTEYFASWYGKHEWFDEKNYFLSKSGFFLDGLAGLCQLLSRLVAGLTGKVKKCLVLDLDNTLWGGVIGDDGLNGITLDPNHPIGEAFLSFQAYVKQLKERGVLLAVCSKNNEEIAKEPFQKLEHSILKLEDFACFVANWNDKFENIKQISKTLNIGLDALVFFDDNPAERQLVGLNSQEIEIIPVPDDPTHYCRVLEQAQCFEWLNLSREDINRTSSFANEKYRQEILSNAVTYDEYLSTLKMEAWVYVNHTETISRFTQLINKSNQFNVRTVRYNESEIREKMSLSKKFTTLAIHMKDVFVDYGIIACVILENRGDHAFVDTWVMSCRVLKRDMELFTFNRILDLVGRWKISTIITEYRPTAKNTLVSSLYDEQLKGVRMPVDNENGALNNVRYQFKLTDSRFKVHIAHNTQKGNLNDR